MRLGNSYLIKYFALKSYRDDSSDDNGWNMLGISNQKHLVENLWSQAFWIIFNIASPRSSFGLPMAFSELAVDGHLEVHWAKVLQERRMTLFQNACRRASWRTSWARLASWWRGLKDNSGLFPEDVLTAICGPTKMTIPCPASMLTQP